MFWALHAFPLFEFELSHTKFASELICYLAAVRTLSFVEVIVLALKRTHIRGGDFTGQAFTIFKEVSPTLVA